MRREANHIAPRVLFVLWIFTTASAVRAVSPPRRRRYAPRGKSHRPKSIVCFVDFYDRKRGPGGQPAPPEALCAARQIMAVPAGFEPATSRFGIWHSIQLNYGTG